jgi:IS1 family transposase
MSSLPLTTRVRVAAALADGVSMRGVERLTGVTVKTIGTFLLTLGEGCSLVHAAHMQNLTSDVLELDEVWTFVSVKNGHLRDEHPHEFGDAYTFVALDSTSRAVVSYLTDKRTAAATIAFAQDIRDRVTGKPQLTTDGWISYTDAIEKAFGTRVHYAKNLKTYALDEANGASRDDVRYSRGRCIASQKIPVIGSPDESKITTAHVERNNLTTRLWCRRMTRLTNGFSRRLVFLRAALALHFAVYNFCRVHAALRVTPAMQLGVTDHVWSMEELVTAALAAHDDAPPLVPPPVPPTPATEAGARVRAEKRAAMRREARVAATTAPMSSTHATSATMATVSHRHAAAPRVTHAGAPDGDVQLTLNLPAPGSETAPRGASEPADAATDFRWMW